LKWILLGVVVVCNTFGDVLNTRGMKRHGAVQNLRPTAVGRLIGALSRNPYVLAGIGAMALSFFALLALLSIADLSFTIPATGIGYLLETLLAKYVLKEHVSAKRWAGATLVACGVVLLSL
jgi:drug/metabolite transporter (DMT)-like permease